MSKSSFCKAWKVIANSQNPGDVPADGTFEINDTGGDQVEILFTGFAAAYSSPQVGTYHSNTNEIKVSFTPSQQVMTVTCCQGDGVTCSELEIFVALAPAVLNDDVIGPEVGEWGAEAESGG